MNQSHKNKESKIWPTLRADFRRDDLKSSLHRDYDELQDVFLEEERKKRLSHMGRIKRWLLLSWWLFKSMILKLSPLRRILLVIGIVLFFATGSDGGDRSVLSLLLILFVLLLELKDKLLARDELEAGRQIQQALMPKPSPEIPGYALWLFTRSANEVGGDLVDFMTLSENRFVIAIGDVSGKGLPAALLMAKLQATIRALAYDAASITELAQRLNGIFYRDSVPASFASLLYVELQPSSNTIRYFNAGHMPPLVLRGRELFELPASSPALGLSPGAEFKGEQFELQPADLILFYSDGLTEARNQSEEFFGEERLSNSIRQLAGLAPAEFGAKLLQEVDRFVGQGRPHDDISFAVLQRI